VPTFAFIVRVALLAVLCQSVGACGLDTSLRHNLCTSDSDCNPGHACVEGICGSPPPDTGGADAATDVREAGCGAGGDEAGYAGDGGDGGDAGDGTRDPCVPTADDGPRANVSDAPGALVGVWRLCDATPGPEVSWLVGATGTIQIDATTWQRGGDAPASGLYFLVLEGTKGVVHFIDPDVTGGLGADFSATISTGSQVLELSPCDGPETCSDHVSRFVPAAPAASAGR